MFGGELASSVQAAMLAYLKRVLQKTQPDA